MAPAAPDEMRVSMFCYPGAALPGLFEAWADGDARVACIVPEGVAAGALDRFTRGRVPRPGSPHSRGGLCIHAIPFLAQDDYDRLLWQCDVNFVRGEDSFVRAQWAGRAFVWNIYPQEDGAHWRKVDAFLDLHAAGLGAAPDAALRRFWHAWNGDPGAGPIGAAWLAFAAARPHLQEHAEAWAGRLASRPDLVTGLVNATPSRV